MTEETWTADDEAVFRPLYQKWQRIRWRKMKDSQGRLKQYGARRRKSPLGT